MFLKRLFLIAVILGFIHFPGSCQKMIYRTIGHQTEGSEGRNVVEAADGGYFLSYYMYFSGHFIASLTKLNCAGQVEWEKFYDEGMSVIPVDVIPQSNNGCLLALSVRTSSGENQIAVLKTDAVGNTIWTQRLNIQAANATGCMIQHADGSIYVCGSDTNDVTGFIGTSICKLDDDGVVVWRKQYGEYLHHSPRFITVTSDHRVIVVGQVGIPTFIFTNIFVLVTDKNGNFLKRKIVTTYYDDEPRAACTDNSGNIYITGYSYFVPGEWDMFFLKMDNQLNIIQSKFYNGGTPQGEQARFIARGDGNTFTLFGDVGGFNERNPAIVKLTEDGDVLWAKQYAVSPSYTNYLFHGASTSDGGILMTGDARPVNQFRIAPFMKTDSVGNLGCFTGQLNLTSRNETFLEEDSTLLVSNFSDPLNTTSVASSPLQIITSNTAICQNLIPCGNFYFTEDTLCPQPCFSFTENSITADNWLWTFEDGNPPAFNGQFPPQVCFEGYGPHLVTLELTNAIGSVMIKKYVDAYTYCPVFVPDVFTPNGDDMNNTFHATGVNEPFTLSIFNRWGEEIFSSNNSWWNGKNKNETQAVDGVYFYILKLPQTNRVFNGTVHLLR